MRIVRVRSTEQSGIKGVKILFDPNIIDMQYNKKSELKFTESDLSSDFLYTYLNDYNCLCEDYISQICSSAFRSCNGCGISSAAFFRTSFCTNTSEGVPSVKSFPCARTTTLEKHCATKSIS